MKRLHVFAAALSIVVFFSLCVPSHARDANDTYKEIWAERSAMDKERMEMMRDVMGILKGLNHVPTAAEKERLATMMERLGEMMERHDVLTDEISKRIDRKMEKKDD